MGTRRSIIERFITQLKDVPELLPGLHAQLLKRSEEPELGFTSLPGFNQRIWGLRPGGITVLGGRTSIGKSALALQFAFDLADQGREVVFLSLEMTAESLAERLFCNLCQLDNYELLSGRFKTEPYLQEKWGVFQKLVNVPLKISSSLGKTLNDVNTMVELLQPKPRVIFIDYVQAIRKGVNERMEMDDYILHFRELCMRYDIAGVLVSQSSRKVFDEKNKEPSLENLKSTGCLEETAETVLLVFWPHFYNPNLDRNIYKIIIAKQRNGRTGDYFLNFIPENYRFTELTLEQKENLSRIKGKVQKIKEQFKAKEANNED